MIAYHREEPLVESASYRSYREVLAETGARVARKLGKSVKSGMFLADSLPYWKTFPDTNGALEALRRGGCSLGILSNVDDELLAETLRRFTVDFALIITAEKVRSYKPAHGHFLEAKKRLQDRRWIHAAQSYFHDIVPASELGIASAWINRKSEKPTGAARPTAEFRDLADFAQWM